MKIINNISNQVIDVPVDHAQMLMRQGWKEHKEIKDAVRIEEEVKEVPQKEVKRTYIKKGK